VLNIPQLKKIQTEDPYLYETLKKIVAAINSLAHRAGIDTTGAVATPSPIASLTVAAANGYFDVAILDTSNPHLGINYFVETDTDPSFANARVWDLGSSRNIVLPLGNQTLYFRAYSQYQNSVQSTKVTFGSPATAVTGGGASPPPPLPTQGSGSGGGGGFGEGFGEGRIIGPRRVSQV